MTSNNSMLERCLACKLRHDVPLTPYHLTRFTRLTQKFILELDITSGYGVARYLGLPFGIENNMALGLWFDANVRCTHPATFLSFGELKQKARMQIPPRYFH